MPFPRASVLLLFGICACSDSALIQTLDAGGEDTGEIAQDMQILLDAGVSADAGEPTPDLGTETTMDAGTAPGPDVGPSQDLGAPDLGPQAPPPCAIDLQPHLGALQVPGLSAALVKDGRVVCTAVAGQADIEAQRPV